MLHIFVICYKNIYSRSNMTEALEWLIEHQDDTDNEDDETDFLSMDTENTAGPSSSVSTKKKSLKDACIELFETGNSCTKKCVLII